MLDREHILFNFGLLGYLFWFNTLFDVVHLNLPVDPLIILFSTLIFTAFFSPDIDVKSSSLKRWGLLAIFILPFTHFLKHGQTSHKPVLGYFYIIGYFTILAVALYFVGISLLDIRLLELGTVFSFVLHYLRYFVLIFMTGLLAHTGHLIADKLTKK